MTDRNAPTKVVVIGGGHAGTMAANHLRMRGDIDITLVNPRPKRSTAWFGGAGKDRASRRDVTAVARLNGGMWARRGTCSTWDSPPWRPLARGLRSRRGFRIRGDDVIVSRDRNLAYIANITAAVGLPVSADFMSGYGLTPEDVAESVTRCVATGVAGLSIEDATDEAFSPLYELPIAVARVRAAPQAIDQSGEDVLLIARAECYHVGHPDRFGESS